MLIWDQCVHFSGICYLFGKNNEFKRRIWDRVLEYIIVNNFEKFVLTNGESSSITILPPQLASEGKATPIV